MPETLHLSLPAGCLTIVLTLSFLQLRRFHFLLALLREVALEPISGVNLAD